MSESPDVSANSHLPTLPLTDFDAEDFYAYPPGQPWVRTDFVSSLDGAAWAADGTSGDLGGDVDKRAFSMMRSLADIIVVGAGTARTEGYRPLTERSVDQAVRARHDLSPAPILIVVSRSLNVPDELIDGGAVIVTSHAAPPERIADLQQRTDVLVHGADEIDWPAVCADWFARGWHRVLCEGGPSLHGDLLRAGVVDEICVTIAPLVASGPAGRIAADDQSLGRSARLAGVAHVDGVLLTRWHPDRA